jgi:non-ribosomal peptide synthase protein (TIGR01720 family)
VCTTLYRVEPAGAYGSRIPIGKPIGHTTVLLLDDQLQPVADGVPGELCVAGVSLAIGYLHQEALTSTQFPAYDGVPGNRIYRTGDIAVRRPDGLLELLGRRDNQVKIRGYRIELGEIEAVLLQADGVREVAVLAQDDATGRRLIAYATGTADEGRLRDAVARRLPDFMVPSAFHLLDEMPTTANGKIDRKALPSLVVADTGHALRDAAETPDQERLMALWVEVLGRPVGIRDNFFAMGGDSILVIQLVSRARALGLRLTPTQVFEHPTIEQLATIAVRTAGSVDEAGPAEGDAPLGPMQQWFLSQQTDAPQHFNQTVLFEVSTGLAPDALRAAVGVVAGHHDGLRLAFTRTASGWKSAYAPVNRLPTVVVVDLTAVAPAARLDAIRRDGEARQRTFALDASPLLQVIAYTTGTDSTAWVLLIAHHLVIDGVSWRILLDDLQRAYVAAAAGRSLDLPPRTTSYRGWIARLEEESAMFLDELPFWQTHTAGSMSLPRDLDPAVAPRMDSSASVHTMLTPDATEVLLRTAPRTIGVEVQDILLTALVRSTSTWTGHAGLPITLESHGRPELFDDVDTTRLVGWCTSQFPLRLTVDAAASGIDAIKSIKEQVRSVPHLGVGFGVLSYLADVEIGAGLRAFPSPPVLFNYLGQVSGMVTADASWIPVLDGVPGDVSPTQVRSHLLEVNAMVAEGALSVTWSYSTEEFLPTTIERLAAAFITELHELVSATASASGPQFTPSDFPAARIDQDALAVLLGQLGA